MSSIYIERRNIIRILKQKGICVTIIKMNPFVLFHVRHFGKKTGELWNNNENEESCRVLNNRNKESNLNLKNINTKCPYNLFQNNSAYNRNKVLSTNSCALFDTVRVKKEISGPDPLKNRAVIRCIWFL